MELGGSSLASKGCVACISLSVHYLLEILNHISDSLDWIVMSDCTEKSTIS